MGYEFMTPGKAAVIIGGQWGSEGKGAVSAWIAHNGGQWDIVSSNAGSQSGHTSYLPSPSGARKLVLYHLPTAPAYQDGEGIRIAYLNAGAVIDPDVLMEEIKTIQQDNFYLNWRLFIHPNAAIITPDAKLAERDPNSPQTKISSTQKGVGETIAQKVRRAALIARDCPGLMPMVKKLDLNARMSQGKSVLLEVPQGVGLSLNSEFYPYTTSRDCTVAQALSDAHIHPSFLGNVALVLRTYPIRVGNLPGNSSGDCYSDQKEISWGEVGAEPEITTVTKRVRRVFTFSFHQLWDALTLTRPDSIHLTFCDYMNNKRFELDNMINRIVDMHQTVCKKPFQIVTHWGPKLEHGELRGKVC